MKCSICQKEIYKIISLGHHPASDAFLKEEELNKQEIYYPLDVYYCEECGLVQSGYAVDPEILFKEYVYNTGTNNSLIKNFNELTENLIEKFNLNKDDLAIDIGSNDGTLLKGYKNRVKILGVDPSSVAKIAIQNNIPTINDFFNKETALKIVEDYGKAKVITATNTFAHVKELTSFVEGIKELLTDDGIFIQESHYFLNLIAEMQWDSIYHEHLRYYTLRALINLFNKFNMDLFDAELITTHGGSIRTYACKKNAYPISDNVNKLLENERENGLFNKKTYLDFGKKIINHKFEIQEMLRNIKKNGKKIVGIGAPAKGNTLLNYCNINTDILNYIVEKSDLKIGMYTPGTHIKVVDEKLLFEEQPDYGFLLSWNIADELIPKLKKLGYNGKIIVPLPSPHIKD